MCEPILTRTALSADLNVADVQAPMDDPPAHVDEIVWGAGAGTVNWGSWEPTVPQPPPSPPLPPPPPMTPVSQILVLPCHFAHATCCLTILALSSMLLCFSRNAQFIHRSQATGRRTGTLFQVSFRAYLCHQ